MLGIAEYGAFCATIVVFLALPGPGTLALLAATGAGGLRAGAAATFGVIAGDQVLLWLAVAGIAALLTAQPLLFGAVRYLGAAYLVWTGLRLIIARGRTSDLQAAVQPHIHHHARRAFLITLLNPKAIVFYMAFFPLFIHPASHQGMTTFAAMAATIAAITAVYCLLLCALGQLVGAKLRTHRKFGRWLERATGILLVGFGIRLASQ